MARVGARVSVLSLCYMLQEAVQAVPVRAVPGGGDAPRHGGRHLGRQEVPLRE